MAVVVTLRDIVSPGTEKLFDMVNDGVLITDEHGVVFYINEAYLAFIQKTRDECVGRLWREFRPLTFLDDIIKKRQPLMDIPRQVGEFESYCDYFPIIEDDVLLGVLLVVKDIRRIKGIINELAQKNFRINQLDSRIKETYSAHMTFKDIIGSEEGGLESVINTAKKIAKTDSSILLLGESGVGKDVMAQAIHNGSSRRYGPFVDINCAAIPENLLESELFGYVEGAFSGAKKSGKIGLFEIANGGTIFLDEISEMGLNLQAKLLRVLQDRKLKKIGSEKSFPIDVRIIAASNKDIEKLMEDGNFRTDLYYRLAVFVIKIPPLRERKGGIEPLVKDFIRQQERRKGTPITIGERALSLLQEYSWPGNVRELKNAVEHACVMSDDGVITVHDFPSTVFRTWALRDKKSRDITKGQTLAQMVSEFEQEILIEYLKFYGYSTEDKKKIAAHLNIAISTLYNKLRDYGIEKS